MSSKVKELKSEQRTFQKSLTIVEQNELSMQIQHFIQKRIPTFVKYRLTQLVNEIKTRVDIYIDVRKSLIERLGVDGRIQPTIDGAVNPKHTEYVKEISPVEEQKTEITFAQLPLSNILRKNDNEDEGGYPMVYDLFFMDDLSQKLFDKWTKENEEAAGV